MAARACAWAPDPGGGGGALELTGVEVSQVFAVSPRRGAWDATLEALAQAFTAARKPKNVALTAWPSGGSPRYLVGELASGGARGGPAGAPADVGRAGPGLRARGPPLPRAGVPGRELQPLPRFHKIHVPEAKYTYPVF